MMKTANSSTDTAAIRSPQMLQIRDGVSRSYGAHQIWYPTFRGRMGGCGPTAASNLIWYLAATRPDSCGALFDGDGTKRADMLRLMQTMWNYVTPGSQGVNKAAMLADGVTRFGAERGVPIAAQVLEIPPDERNRPDRAQVQTFLSEAFCADAPVAFLNLSNGAVRNLDNWHWVTLIAIDDAMQAEMYDQSRRQMVDIGLWLDTTKNGGAFVQIHPA